MGFYFSFDPKFEKGIDVGGEALVKVVIYALDGSDYENGELETIRDTANNACKFLAHLSLMLVEKGVLTTQELKQIIDPSILGYEDGNHKWPKRTEGKK